MDNLLSSPEFMDELRRALLLAAQELPNVLGKVDAENQWLTAQEARAFLKRKDTAFRKLLREQPDKIRVSTSLGASEPRYQLASLQQFMREGAGKAKADPQPGTAESKQQPTRKGHKKTEEKAPGRMREFPLPI